MKSTKEKLTLIFEMGTTTKNCRSISIPFRNGDARNENFPVVDKNGNCIKVKKIKGEEYVTKVDFINKCYELVDRLDADFDIIAEMSSKIEGFKKSTQETKNEMDILKDYNIVLAKKLYLKENPGDDEGKININF